MNTNSRRIAVVTNELALEKLKPSDQYLYQVLEDNIRSVREKMLLSGQSAEQKQELFAALSECKELQTKLITEVQSSDDTQAINLKTYKEATKVDVHRTSSAVRSSEDTQDIDLRSYKPVTNSHVTGSHRAQSPRSSDQAINLQGWGITT